MFTIVVFIIVVFIIVVFIIVVFTIVVFTIVVFTIVVFIIVVFIISMINMINMTVTIKIILKGNCDDGGIKMYLWSMVMYCLISLAISTAWSVWILWGES